MRRKRNCRKRNQEMKVARNDGGKSKGPEVREKKRRPGEEVQSGKEGRERKSGWYRSAHERSLRQRDQRGAKRAPAGERDTTGTEGR